MIRTTPKAKNYILHTKRPFGIADNPGLDTYVLIEQSWKALGVGNLMTGSNIVEQMVKESRLGRKVGKGFYNYTPEGKRLPWNNKEQT